MVWRGDSRGLLPKELKEDLIRVVSRKNDPVMSVELGLE